MNDKRLSTALGGRRRLLRRGKGGLSALFLIAAACALLAGAACGAEGGGKTYALLIGLNYDNDPAMQRMRLRYSINDAKAVREMLTSYCGVNPDDIVMLTDDDRPTPGVIRRKLAELAEKATERDRILLFYSGHGLGNKDGWAMVPYDFRKDDINGTLLWNRDISAILESSRAAEMIFISDSCYSGNEKSVPEFITVKNPDYGSKDSLANSADEEIVLEFGSWGDLTNPAGDGSKGIGRQHGIIRLCSSGSGEVSREYPPAKLGAFTNAIAGNVKKWWSENAKGELTMGRLYQAIVPEVQETGWHTPFMTENGDAVVLAEKGAGDDSSRVGGRVYALVVGISYENDPTSRASRLPGTQNDARAIRDVLVKYGGCSERDVTLLLDGDKPDRSRLIGELKKLAGRAGPNDRIVFFFSGHGGKRGDRGNIIPHRYQGNWNNGVAYSDDIKPIMEGSKAASKWMIIDACHSGLKSFGFSGELTEKGAVPEWEVENLDMFVSESEAGDPDLSARFDIKERVPELIRFTGAYGAEFTYESRKLKMGFFTYHLSEAMSGKADADKDGRCTGGELIRYVQPRVMQATADSEQQQKPRLSANGDNVIFTEHKPQSQPQPERPPAATPGSAKGRVHALVVGISYENDSTSRASRLPGTQNDARAIRDALVKYGGCSERDVTLLLDGDKPDRSRLIGELKKLAGRAGPNDRIVFFFSGHGGKRGDRGNIIPHRYQGNWNNGVAYSDDIKPIMEGSKAASKWMIIDACHSGLKSFGFSGELTEKGAVPEWEVENLDMFVSESEAGDPDLSARFDIKERVPELIRFTGAYGAEFTYESRKLKMGFFTYHLSEAMSGKADADKDGRCTGGELIRYVQPRVMQATADSEQQQKPRLSANGFDVVFTGRAAGGSAAPSQPPSQHQQGGRVTELHRASMRNDLGRVEGLLDAGMNVDVRDDTGWTALHYAPRAEMAELLLSRGANHGSRSGAGYTPMHIAAMFGRAGVIKALLRGGADPKLKDKWGKMPLHHALENGNREAIEVLKGK